MGKGRPHNVRRPFSASPENGYRYHQPNDPYRKVEPKLKNIRVEEFNNDINSLIKTKELKEVALLRAKEGEWKESCDILQSVLQIEEDIIRSNSHSIISPLDLANTFFHLGISFNWLGDPKSALNAFTESFILRKTFLGENHKDVVSAQYYISMIQGSKEIINGSAKNTPKVSFNIEPKPA